MKSNFGTNMGETVKLSAREVEALNLLLAGMTSKEISNALFRSDRTVHFHLNRIYRKFGVTNRLQALLRATRLGFLTPQDLGVEFDQIHAPDSREVLCAVMKSLLLCSNRSSACIQSSVRFIPSPRFIHTGSVRFSGIR